MEIHEVVETRSNLCYLIHPNRNAPISNWMGVAIFFEREKYDKNDKPYNEWYCEIHVPGVMNIASIGPDNTPSGKHVVDQLNNIFGINAREASE